MLASLCIIGAYSMAESLASNPITVQMFSQLRILSVDFRHLSETEDFVKFIISNIAQTLEILNIIDINEKGINDEGVLDFSRLPALRHLNILRCIEYDLMGTLQFPLSIRRLLKLRGSTSDVQTMDIHLGYGRVEPGTEERLLLPDLGWADFDAILADENYRSLEKVTLNVRIGFIPYSEPLPLHVTERAKLLIGKLFPAVNASGRIKMEVVVM
ncbi:hypothetical protein M413DRAFT_9714 [Hebeloma cylindrosporum]|uniref:Uncharacterized protein n=1 Tax=Hebeloma cylindrosporum TaxID=76867 RepID=A0A0C3C4K7_HEBCY|nr:hypothetical protein M413DRAFT_9714 [Hebeloma cylindrosporum h7]